MIVAPGPTPNTVRAADGRTLTVPEGWALLIPGDAALTRRVKEAGDHWLVQEKKGRKIFSRGVWAPAATIDRIRAELETERSTEGYAKKKEADARRRDKAQAEYVEDFNGAVLAFLAFHPNHADLGDRLARAVTDNATPVGSGTVARTRRIPVEQRAEAAVIAWMRHQTTGYDGMVIPRIKGKRREVRRMLAARSKEMLARYRRGEPVPEGCPLKKALGTLVAQSRYSMKKNVEESRRVARLVGAKANLCWRNAVDVVYNVPEYAEATYVEGLVLNPRTPTVVQEHGWIEKECEIVDPTLPELELRYFPAIKWAGILDIVVMEGRHQSLPFFRTSEYTTQAVCQAMETARCDALTWAETAVPEGDNEQ